MKRFFWGVISFYSLSSLAVCLTYKDAKNYNCIRFEAGDSYCKDIQPSDVELLAFRTTHTCSKELASSLNSQLAPDVIEPIKQPLDSDFEPYKDLREHHCYKNPITPNADKNCYSSDSDPLIARYLQPNKIYKGTYGGKNKYRYINYNETKRDMKVIHCLVREGYKEYGIDPRQVFTNMIGESLIIPDIMNGEGSSAYGIFQMLGDYYPRISKRALIESYQKYYEEISPRVVQVFYYIYEHERRHYESARWGCFGKPYSQLTNLQKMSEMTLGNPCVLSETLHYLNNVHTYKKIAPALVGQIIDLETGENKKAKPICE